MNGFAGGQILHVPASVRIFGDDLNDNEFMDYFGGVLLSDLYI